MSASVMFVTLASDDIIDTVDGSSSGTWEDSIDSHSEPPRDRKSEEWYVEFIELLSTLVVLLLVIAVMFFVRYQKRRIQKERQRREKEFAEIHKVNSTLANQHNKQVTKVTKNKSGSKPVPACKLKPDKHLTEVQTKQAGAKTAHQAHKVTGTRHVDMNSNGTTSRPKKTGTDATEGGGATSTSAGAGQTVTSSTTLTRAKSSSKVITMFSNSHSKRGISKESGSRTRVPVKVAFKPSGSSSTALAGVTPHGTRSPSPVTAVADI